MALLQCEICGGKLKGRPGGIYECEFCGVEYDTAWAKAKIQEIKGTVKVEGTVEVTGSVKIDGPVEVKGGASAESLLKRAQLALEDGQSQTAKDYFEKVLSMDPNSAEAYLGLAMIDAHVNDLEALVNAGDWKNHNYRRGKQFAGIDLTNQLADYEQAVTARRKQAEDEQIQKRKAQIERLKPLMERSRNAAKLIAAGRYFTAAVNLEDQVMLTSNTVTWEKTYRKSEHSKYINVYLESDNILLGENSRINVSTWKDIAAVSARSEIVAGLTTDGRVMTEGMKDAVCWSDMASVSAGGAHIVGLTRDGRVMTAGSNQYSQCDVGSWKNIVAVSAGMTHTVGLVDDGTVVATGSGLGACDVGHWKDIVAVSAGQYHTVGLTAEGRVVVTHYTGSISYGQDNVGDWQDIVAVSAGFNHTVGLTADGRVKAVGENYRGQCDVDSWRNVIVVSAGQNHTVGLTADGKILTAGEKTAGRGNAGKWKLFENLDNREEEKKALIAEQEDQKLLKIYRRGCNFLASAQYATQVRMAKKDFESLGNYRDARQKLLECDRRIQELEQKEQEQRDKEKKAKYLSAMKKTTSVTMENMKQAKKEFIRLGDFEDSREKAAWCEEKIQLLEKLDQLWERKKELGQEAESLGIFARKRKKEIADEIVKLDTELEQLEKERWKK